MQAYFSDQSMASHAHAVRRARALKQALLMAAMAALANAWTPHALAQQADTLYIRSLAATCANCHGTNGKAVDGSAVVGLAGMPADYTVAQMNAFKSGARTATIMHQISKGYSDAQIAQIAAYFAAQKK
jgi:cytochrome subunit of sulfide dehydrogenase